MAVAKRRRSIADPPEAHRVLIPNSMATHKTHSDTVAKTANVGITWCGKKEFTGPVYLTKP
jgi:hypothetical protein